MTLGSLFTGIGGLDLGLERAGFEVKWQVESNPWCRRVLEKHWPGVPRYERVEDVSAANVAPVDCIAGGFPCQDISNAGARRGIDGDRSGLWREFSRIIRDLRPRVVVVENVSALLARGLGRVLGDLAESGYDAEWDCIPAAAVGAPHRRDRIFIIAHAVSDGLRLESRGKRGTQWARALEPREHGEAWPLADADCERWQRREELRTGESLAGSGGQDVADPSSERTRGLPERSRGSPADPDRSGEDVAHAAVEPERESTDEADAFSARGKAWPQPRRSGWWDTEPDVGRVAHGVPGRVDRLRGLGNAVVPQVAEWIGRLALER